MPTAEELKIFGREVRKRRLAIGESSLRAFARKIEISSTHLSQLERAYANPKQGVIVPSDDVLEKLAKGLDVPISRLHMLLGRFPDQPFPELTEPDATEIAERYLKLPPYAKEMLRGMLGLIEEMVVKKSAADTRTKR